MKSELTALQFPLGLGSLEVRDGLGLRHRSCYRRFTSEAACQNHHNFSMTPTQLSTMSLPAVFISALTVHTVYFPGIDPITLISLVISQQSQRHRRCRLQTPACIHNSNLLLISCMILGKYSTSLCLNLLICKMK